MLCHNFERVQVVEHRGREVPELPPPQRSEEHHQEVQPEQQHHHIKGRQAGRHRDQVNPSPSNRQEQPESNQFLPQTRTALLGHENWRSGQEDGRSLSGLHFVPLVPSVMTDFFSFQRIVEIKSLVVGTDNCVVTSSIDRSIKIWDLDHIFEKERHIDKHSLTIDSIR